MTSLSANNGQRHEKEDANLLHPKIHCHAAFMSDWHLGTITCCAEDLVQFFNHIEPQNIYLIGDVFDFWKMGRFGIEKLQKLDPVQKLVLSKLQAFSARGVNIVYVPGNHDNCLREAEAQRQFLSMMQADVEPFETTRVSTDGRRMLILHGDVFDGALLRHNIPGIIGAQLYEFLSQIGFRLNGSQKSRKPQKILGRWERPATWMLIQSFQDAYRCLLYPAFEKAAFKTLFSRNAEIQKWNADHPLEKPKQYFDEIRCGHTHIPVRKERSSPRDSHGQAIGPERVIFSNTGCWTGLPRNDGADDKTRFEATQKWIPFNTAILEYEDSKEEIVRWIPTVGIMPFEPKWDGFLEGISLSSARKRIDAAFREIRAKGPYQNKGLGR